jgi:two-component system response regulator FlrC
LLESELFGHEKGAFTGALAKKPGKFDLANGGTILLDEISEMDISLQAKLLRALQEGEIDPVGGKGPHKIDARVIATTNRKLKSWVDEGRFRADLYYRLNVMPFYIPALRERAEDIDVLAEHFAGKYAAANGKSVCGLSEEALAILKAHDWPGNIRELENTVARAVLMARGERIEAHDIFMDEAGFMAALERNAQSLVQVKEAKAQAADEADGHSGGDCPALMDGEAVPLMTIEEMERCLIGKALNETSGNRTHAAKILGISVRTLRNKLAEYRSGQDAGPLMAASG